MKILVIGSGGREHAIYSNLIIDPKVRAVYMIGNNGGVRQEDLITDVDAMDFAEVEAVINKLEIDLTVVGPEVYLEAGIVDYMCARGHKIVGPTKYCANLESSKNFAKEMMAKRDVPTAKYEYVSNTSDGLAVCDKFGYPIVLKYDGLAAGKGVSICQTQNEAKAYFKDIFDNSTFGNDGVVIEECMVGEEYSVFAYVNGENYALLPVAQDYKRAFDGDQGPNTGGMGVNTTSKYDSNLQLIENSILKPILNQFCLDENPYTGFLYIGLMETNEGPKVVEFNCRLGDPETEIILQKLNHSLLDVFESVDNEANCKLDFSREEYVGVVLAATGYPNSYPKNVILDLEEKMQPVFHMGTKLEDGKLLSTGGRVLILTDSAVSVDEARTKVYDKISLVLNEQLFNRSDIGLGRI